MERTSLSAPGEFRWPYPGNSAVRPWGVLLAAYGDFDVAADNRADVLLKRLRASRLNNFHGAEMRKQMRVDLPILDDFTLQPLDPLDTADIYELVLERHRAASTLITSNCEPIESIGQMADALLAQSAIDRLPSAAY